MKQYYTLKLKLTPKQVELFGTILDKGITRILDNTDLLASKGAEENRLISIESKIDKAITDSGYYRDIGYNRDMYKTT